MYTRFPESKLNLIWWIPVGLLWWVVQAALKLIVLVPGLFVVPFLYKYRFTELDNLPLWAMPWANPEDWHGGHKNYNGSIPPWWQKKEYLPIKQWIRKLFRRDYHYETYGESLYSFWRYHARRNPSDGLRNLDFLQLWIDKERVWFWTPRLMEHYEPWHDRRPGWRGYMAGQGPYIGIKIQWVRDSSYSELKLGFRVEPRDAIYELAENSARRHLGASFASKLIFHRELD
jgi:hypothetical protein